jgi:beta-galactosidase
VCRVSGKVDAVRLPKQLYFAHRVMQNPRPDLHILGHWSYPFLQPATTESPAQKTMKTVYVVANTEEVELFLNGKSLGVNTTPENGYVFAFPHVAFAPGTLSAVGRNAGRTVATHTLSTTGPPVAIKLTPMTGPQGLQADGQDVAVIDFEVVDATGERCPTDYARIDFNLTGPAIWRGGYNSGIIDSTNNLYLNTECGINRVFLRSTLSPGAITLTATRAGMRPATVHIESKPVSQSDGISRLVLDP